MRMLNKIIQSFFLLLICTSAQMVSGVVPSDPRNVNPVEVGSMVLEAKLSTVKGDTVSLEDVLGNEKSILIFYRGGWCPYCVRHLAAVGEYEEMILEKGYRIIAISPDLAEDTAEYADTAEFNYSLYSDSELSTIKAFGLAFESVSKRTQKKRVLPVPAIFIVDAEGRITFRHVDVNYKERLTPEDLLKALD